MPREYIGYTGKNASCFNFNADRFCCTDRNQQLYNNILTREARARQTVGGATRATHSLPRNYNPHDLQVPLSLYKTGMVQPTEYTLSASDSWYVPCSRMPCGIYKNKFPCSRK